MSILIKGMDMPTVDEEIIIRISPNGTVMTEYALPITGVKAVPVPPHGDLIERDALDVIGYCGIPQGYEDTFDSGVIWLAERIDELPTIIPASEED